MFKKYNEQEEREQEEFFISSVSKRSELLKDEDKDVSFDDYVKRFFEEPKLELTYKNKNTKKVITETQLIKNYKKAMCL